MPNHSLTLSSGATLRHLSAGNGPSYLMVPGGPGIASDYLHEALRLCGLEGDIWGFDLPGQFDPGLIVDPKFWPTCLKEAASRLEKPILIGHSFGAMLILQSTLADSALRGAILISGSPDQSWRELAKAKVAKSDPSIWRAQAASWEDVGTDDALRELFSAWAPLYFEDRHVEAGKNYLKSLKYSAAIFKQAQRFHDNFKTLLNLKTTPYVIISGQLDEITPGNCFKKEPFNSKPPINYFNVNRAGHFPWIESPKEFADALQAAAALL